MKDGSGSVRLMKFHSDKLYSHLIPVTGGKTYSFSFFMKTANGPSYVAAQVSIHDRQGKFIRNLSSRSYGTSIDGRWEECVLPVDIPQEVAMVMVQAIKKQDTQQNGQVWIDDLFFGEGIGFQKPPATKRTFAGTRVRIDKLGNFEVKKGGKWMPFFPLCIYSSQHWGKERWHVYSRQGFNVDIWAGNALMIQWAKDARSEFNPDGMMACISLAQYTLPSGWAYNDLGHLKSTLNEIFYKGLDDHLLMYYLDNENHHDRLDVQKSVVNVVRQMDRQSHPIYILQGEYGTSRAYSARGLQDVGGTYVGGGAVSTDRASGVGFADLIVLDRLEGEVSPAAIAQFNQVTGAGDMRLRLYNSLTRGAKAMGCYRDEPGEECGPVDETKWWPDFPNLRREIDRLLPLIRQPHWTSWNVEVKKGSGLVVGARDYKGEGYLILVNQQNKEQAITLSLNNLSYSAKEIRDFFSGEKIGTVNGDSISLILPKIGIGSGTRVLRLVRRVGDASG